MSAMLLSRLWTVVVGFQLSGHGDKGRQMAHLELAAAELNRRHGNASIQNHEAACHALEILAQLDQIHGSYCGDEFLNWTKISADEAQAFGVILDHGTPEIWDALGRQQGMSRADVVARLFDLAVTEGARRGFDHAPRVAGPFTPVGAVAPF